ncbi:MAG: amino acid-binding protein [Acidimicrobiia bacterium]|nr:amino acid-binding protein [Acidimicrobiia bacterium]
MNALSVTAVGRDHPGIVADLTGALVDLGCNLEDSSMAVLRGNFAVMLVLSAPASVDRDAVAARLGPVATRNGIVVDVRTAAVDESPPDTGSAWTVTVHGADRPGIVHGITSELAAWGVNITDLTTRVVGPADSALYVMALDVSVPEGVDVPALATALDRRGTDLGVDCNLHPAEPDLM